MIDHPSPAPHSRTAHASARPLIHAPSPTPERAFTIVELIIVMLIIAVIGAIAVGSVRTAQTDGSLARSRSLARNLGEGIEQFQRDHSGRVPGQPGTPDWTPTGSSVGSAASWRSPIDAANKGKPYVKPGALEPLLDGTVGLENSSGTVAPGTKGPARIRYRTDQNLGLYGLVVVVDRRGSASAECYVTNADATTSRAFIARLEATRPC